MDPKVRLFDIVNDRNRPTAPLFCSECRLHRLSANGSVVGLSAPANVSTLLVWGRICLLRQQPRLNRRFTRPRSK